MNEKEIRKIIKQLETIDGEEFDNLISTFKRKGVVVHSDSPGIMPSNGVPLNQPYRLYDADDFPFGSYFWNRTGRTITQVFRLGSPAELGQEDADKLVEGWGMERIFYKEFYNVEDHGATIVFEKRVGDDIVLCTLADYVVSSKSKSKIQKNKVYFSLLGNISQTEWDGMVSDVRAVTTKAQKEPNRVSLVVQTRNGYDTESFELPKQKLDIELNYGKGFKPVHDKIIGTLNKKDGKGLVLLHGTPGTGKTHYLKHLASLIRGKEVLFIPPYLADFITSPEMTPFLIENSNSVLFIEDAENVITDRTVNGTNGVSNILNITDGILSDILKIQIVATFNMDKHKIDKALLRKGRLIAEHKFDALEVEDANALLKHLEKDYVTDKPMTLTEIYNWGEEEYKSEEGEKRKIGFGA